MSNENNISFESDSIRYRSRSILGVPQVPKMTKFLMGKGVVKNEKQAQIALLSIAVLSLLLSTYVFASFVFDVQLFNQTPKLTEEQIQLREETAERFNKIREQQNKINNTQNSQ